MSCGLSMIEARTSTDIYRSGRFPIGNPDTGRGQHLETRRPVSDEDLKQLLMKQEMIPE